MASLQTNVTDSNSVQSYLYYLIITSLMGPPLSVLWNIFLVRALLQRCEIYISDEEHTTHFLNAIPTGINLVCLFFFFPERGRKITNSEAKQHQAFKGDFDQCSPRTINQNFSILIRHILHKPSSLTPSFTADWTHLMGKSRILMSKNDSYQNNNKSNNQNIRARLNNLGSHGPGATWNDLPSIYQQSLRAQLYFRPERYY